jgi:replicative DNA helicase
MFIYREEEYKPTDENRGIAEIIIGKQRNGPTGTLKLAFIKESRGSRTSSGGLSRRGYDRPR